MGVAQMETSLAFSVTLNLGLKSWDPISQGTSSVEIGKSISDNLSYSN